MEPSPVQSLTRGEIHRAIEDAAAELFAAKGYEATTVDDIVGKAAVSKPALYRFFESKKHLYLTLLERHRDELAAAALAEVDPDADPRSWLPAMLDAWFVYVSSHPFTHCLLGDTSGDRDIEALRADLQGRQRAAVVELLREFGEGLGESEVEPLAEVIRSSLYGLALWWADHPDTPRSTLVSVMVRVVTGIALAGHQADR